MGPVHSKPQTWHTTDRLRFKTFKSYPLNHYGDPRPEPSEPTFPSSGWQPGASEVTPLYKHRRLNNRKKHIRLLTIKQIDGAIHCSISIFKLRSAPQFRALSYTWGSATPTFSIFINDNCNSDATVGRYQVRANLFAFLEKYTNREVRESIRYLWIDQICINQSDVNERNHQVRLMSNIYRSARVVTVWLGETTVPTYVPSDCLWTLDMIAKTLYDPYFSRLWIVQEVLLAREADIVTCETDLLMFDGWGLDWRALDEGVKVYGTELQRHHGISQSTLSLFRERRRGYDLNFGSCLAKFCSNECADVRDKVYGFVGLGRDEPAFSVDYTKSAQDVYLDVAMGFRNAYLKRRLKPAPVLKVYPFKPSEYYQILADLAMQMGFSGAKLVSVESMMTEIWTPEVAEEYDGKGCPNHPPIAAMGFEKRTWAERDGRDASSNSESELLPDRWWYECEGQRRYHGYS
jgi:hypothetical protein